MSVHHNDDNVMSPEFPTAAAVPPICDDDDGIETPKTST